MGTRERAGQSNGRFRGEHVHPMRACRGIGSTELQPSLIPDRAGILTESVLAWSEAVPDLDMDGVFRARYHGAANFSGVRFQILYTVLRALQILAARDDVRLQPEGFEDLDLKGLRIGTHHIQVKYRSGRWNWSDLPSPLANFVEVVRASDAQRSFLLLVDAEFDPFVSRLSSHLSGCEDQDIERRFRQLCRRNRLAAEETDILLDNLKIEAKSEHTVRNEIHQLLIAELGFSSDLGQVFLSALVAHVLDWAARRTSFGHVELEDLSRQVREAYAAEEEFIAAGRGLIRRIDWERDATESDFLEGRQVEPGHIRLGFDVVRPRWMDEVRDALSRGRACLIKAASGQGKSTLALRYAFERWNHTTVFEVVAVEDSDQLALLARYLAGWELTGIPILLLVDDGGTRMRRWSELVQAVRGQNVWFIVTSRSEDWWRFGRVSTTGLHVVEPQLDTAEAREIYQRLKQAGRLHPHSKSANWALSRIGPNRRLIEFVYLLTHGQMLEDRLRDQIKTMAALGEPAAKTELLRLVVLADRLGCTTSLSSLQTHFPGEGVATLVRSMQGEYLQLHAGRVSGYHWVRSAHVARILFEDTGPESLCVAVCALLNIVSVDDVPEMVFRALQLQQLDQRLLLVQLATVARSIDVPLMDPVLAGVFRHGERLFYQAHKGKFDEAWDLVGFAGIELLGYTRSPFSKGSDLLDGVDKGHFPALRALSRRFEDSPRGIDAVGQFFEELSRAPQPDPERWSRYYGPAGRTLDWAGVARHQATWLTEIAVRMAQDWDRGYCRVEDLGDFSRGLWRYSNSLWESHLGPHEPNMIREVCESADCADLRIEGGELHLDYFLDGSGSSRANDESMNRLTVARSVFPNLRRYCSDAIWLVPELAGVMSRYDPACKRIPAENLPFRADVARNRAWFSIVEAPFLPTGALDYQRPWHDSRRLTLRFLEGISRALGWLAEGKNFTVADAMGAKGLEVRIGRLAQELPRRILPMASGEDLDTKAEWAQEWSGHVSSFVRSFVDFSNDDDPVAGQACVARLRDAYAALTGMHDEFDRVFQVSDDYFDSRALNANELETYQRVTSRLELFVLDRPLVTKGVNLDTLAERARQQRSKADVAPLLGSDRLRELQCEVGQHSFRIDGLLAAAISVPVEDPLAPVEVEAASNTAIGLSPDLSWLYLIPRHEGRLLETGYRISASRPLGADAEARLPMTMPEAAFASLGVSVGHSLPKVIELRATVLALPLLTNHLVKLRRAASEAEHCATAVRDRLQWRLVSTVEEFQAALSEVQERLRGMAGPTAVSLASLIEQLVEWSAGLDGSVGRAPPIALLDEAGCLAYQLWKESKAQSGLAQQTT